ncbi:hypothetical protein MLD38_011952 [Melastoma candidum]|uniref:Uncharacterized protein n=1 Tax=Melastoma candidum TaxID=119954 RepID=A0ACB9R4R8_9MYRT|nr:hypothetical protein MLD38_011952 [Melastoma candidum]
MSKPGRENINNGESCYFEFVGEDDGNSARTRPIRFEEIMLRRKRKELSQFGNDININNEKHSTVESVKGPSALHDDSRKGESAIRRVRPFLQSEVQKVKPEDGDDNSFKKRNRSEMKKRKIVHRSEIFSKETTGNKEGNISKRRDMFVKRNGNGVHVLETKLRTRLNSEVRYKDDWDGRSMPSLDKAIGHVRNEPDALAGRDLIMESNVKQRYTVKGVGRSERESKKMRHDLELGIANDRRGAMKRDLRRLHDTDASQRLVRKEFTESCYDEFNPKRNLSGTRDHGKNNHRRSLSSSPRVQRRQSDNGRRHEDYSSKSLKERPRRRLDDMEKNRFSSNGSGRHYRSLDVSSGELGKHSQRKREAEKDVKASSPSRRSPERKTLGTYRNNEVSNSGLGGYSPRKRRSVKAVKTPPLSKQSPERKVAGWDIAPTAAQVISSVPLPDVFQLSSQATSTNVHELTSAVSAALSVMMPSVSVSLNVPPIKLSASVESVQLTESSRPMRRLYIENIPTSASEKALMQCLNSNLMSTGANHIHGTQPCISCIIHQEKGLALVEFLTPEDASSALSLDGCPFSGSILKVRRPKDFVEVATSQMIDARKEAAVHVISSTVEDSPHRIFIGGISEVLTSEMLMEIAGVLGQLKGFHFAVSGDAVERCAFLEYVDPSATLKACAALNGVNLGGQLLTVVQADSSSSGIDGNLSQYAIPKHTRPLLQKPTRVLKLRNVFPPDGPLSLSQTEIDEIIEDVRLECARFGLVKSVNVVKHDVSLPLMSDDYAITSDTVQNYSAEDSSGVDRELIVEGNSHVTRREHEEEHQAVTIGSFDGEESRADHQDGNYPDNDLSGDSESGMSQPGKEAVLSDKTYQILSDEAVAGETRQVNDFSDGCHNQGSQEGDAPQYEDNHAYEKSPVKQESTPDAVERGSAADPEPVGDSTTDIGLRKSDDEELLSHLDHIFEQGCVLVEYKRTESSREAAHCLHGRLFDDRTVNVEYVPEDLYVAKFRELKVVSGQ